MLTAVAILLVMAIGILLFVGLTPVGSQIAAERISTLVSTPDRTIAFSPPQGLLSGSLRIDELTLSDSKGTYAEIAGIHIDWSPSALARGIFRAESVSVSEFDLLRTPVPSSSPVPQSSGSGPGFSLPIGIDVAQIDMPNINLSPSLTGRDFSLALKGSINATGPNIILDLDAHRKDEPSARALVDVTYAPAENQLTLKASVSEPQGGLLARLLHLPGAPAVDLALDGAGPLSNWEGNLTGSVAGTPVIAVSGKHMMLPDGSRNIQISGGGELAALMPPTFRPLFADTTDINLGVNINPTGRIGIDDGKVTTGAANLVASGVWDPTGDNSLTASLTGADGPVTIVWPISGHESRITLDTINFTLTGASTAARFNATAALPRAELAQGSFNRIRLQAESEDLNLMARSGSLRTRVTIAQTEFVNEELDRAVKGPVTLDAPLRLDLPAVGLDAATLDSARISGTISGAYNTATQDVSGNFRITAAPDALPSALAPRFEKTILAEGYMERTGGGNLTVENLVFRSNAVEAHGSATLVGGHLESRLAGRIPELGVWMPDTEGAAGFDISATGPIETLSVKAMFNAAQVRLAGKSLQELELALDGVADFRSPSGTLNATGLIDGQPLKIATNLVSSGGQTSAPEIEVEVGPNRLRGALDFSPEFLPEGSLTFDFPDVSLLAALVAQHAKGDLHGMAIFHNQGGHSSVAVQASGHNLARDNIAIVNPQIDLTVPDIRVPAVDGTIRADRIGTETAAVETFSLEFDYQATGTRVNLDARYDNAPLTAAAIIRTGDQIIVDLERFSAAPRDILIRLAAPTTINVDGANAILSNFTLTTGNGSVSVTGTAGQSLDLKAEIEALPANLINSFVPAINAAGSISGTIEAEGSITSPAIRYDLRWSNAQLQPTRQAGIGPLNLEAVGTYANNTVNLERTNLSGPAGLALNASGRIELSEGSTPILEINGEAVSIPASLANAFVPGLDARGTIAGTVTAAGTPQAPAVRYDLTWSGAAIGQTTSAGLSPLQVHATGEYRNSIVSLETNLSGQNNLSLTGGGTITLQDAKGLNLAFNGQIPFAVLAGQLSSQGFILEGTGTIDLAITGTVAAPNITGSASSSGARFIDVRRNLAIEQLAASISFNGTEARLDNFTGDLSTGGTISATGTVGITPGSGFPADLSIILTDATYVEGTLLSVTADGTLTVTGPLLNGPVLGGHLTLAEAAITVPAQLPTSLAKIDIRHRNPPPEVARQLRKITPPQETTTARPLALNLAISAPNGIFVRGRGIDAELGGDLAISGTATVPVVSGGFEMRRGRIVILTKRLDFTSGEITFGGSLIPVLDLEATTTSDQTVVTVNVAGVANDPEITFSSSPALPQDEILARLIFGQSMSRLSPLQIAQLADAVGQLAGGGSSSLFETLRSSLGVDDLDIRTDSRGQTTVSVGRYLNDRTYLQVEQGGADGARATINLDIGRGVKLKAGAGTEGGSAGIFYEKEY